MPLPTQEYTRKKVSDFLHSHSAYELIPESGKVVVLDVDLPVRQAFHALHEQVGGHKGAAGGWARKEELGRWTLDAGDRGGEWQKRGTGEVRGRSGELGMRMAETGG